MELIGRVVSKEFTGSRVLTGVVESYDQPTGLCKVAYEDGDSEELELSEVTALVQSVSEKVAKKRGRKPKKRHRNRDDPGKGCGISVDGNHVHGSGDCAAELGLGQNLIDEVSVNGNLHKSVEVNGGLDLNLDVGSPANVDCEQNSFFRASIDLNLSAANDIDDGFVSGCKDGGLEKKERGFDLNQMVDDEPVELETEHKEQSVDVPTEIIESKESSSLDTAEKINVANVCLNGALDDNVSGQRVSGDRCLDSIGGDQDEKESVRGNKSDVIDAANVNSDISMLVEAATPVSCEDEPNSSRKRRKVVSRLRSPEEGSLRRSARRAKALAAAQNDETDTDVTCVANDISSPGMSVISEEKPNLMDSEGVEESEVIPTWVQLPPSSKNLDLEGIPVLDFFSVYACVRSFSTLLYLSPFKLEDFVVSLKSKAANSLLDNIHIAILHTLRKHLEFLSTDGSEPASTCLRNLNWDLLDVLTWPIFLAEYLLINGSGLKPCFSIGSLNLVDGDYYKQTAGVKIAILQCLCDDIIEVECVRTEISGRTSTSDFGDIDKNLYNGNFRKTRAFVDSADDTPLAEDNGGDSTDWNSDECCLCKMEGNLICCDGCPAAYHSRCVGVASSLLPDGDWFCPECLNSGHNSETKLQKHVRGAELLGADPHGRVYFHCCGYLLVSESSDAESSFSYYHRDDFCTVIHVLESSGFPYGPISKVLSRHLTVHTELDHQESCTLAVHKPTEHTVPSGNGALKVEEDHERKPEGLGNPTTSSDGSAEVLQCALENTGVEARKRKRGRPRLSDRKPSAAKAKVAEEPAEQLGPLYVNHYSFGRVASAIAEEIMCKPNVRVNEILLRSEEEIISAQLKVILKKSPKFCWPNVQDTCVEIQKEKCGWCYTCRSPDEDRGCLFNLSTTRSISGSFKAELDVLRSKQNKMGHLLDITGYIFSMESRLQGLLLGPWLHPDSSYLKIVDKAFDFASVKQSLLLLESNLRPSAFSADWGKHVDLHVKMGSASHIVISTRISSKSGVGIWRKRNRLPGLDPTPVNASGGLVMLWWRGGQTSRKLFNWKVLPRSLALHAARNGGCMKIPGLTYPDSSEHVKRTKQIAWRAAVEMCTSAAQLALLVRELDSSIRWDEIENTHILPTLDKESQKSVKLFRKVVVRRKCVEGAVVKYLLDFGKRRLLPEVVQRHGSKEDDPTSERKKYWLEESLLPLHLLRNFEEKRIARKAGKMTTKKALKGDKAQKKPLKMGCFDYLFARAERSSYYQCGHCKKDVPISEAVNCQLCDGYFHKRHARRSSAATARKCKYTCHKCRSGKHVQVFKKKGKVKLPKIQNKNGTKSGNLSGKVKAKRGRKPKANRSQMVLGKKRRVQVSKHPSRLSTEANADAGSVLRRSARIKGALVQYDEVSESGKPEKPSKSTSGSRRKSSRISKQRTYPKKRSAPLSTFWKKGLQLTRKLDDERAADFKRRKLLIPSGISAETADQPKCNLCGEEGYTASLKYIACEICGAWYHGDAFGLDAEVIKSLIGFRCHSCLKKNPPTCPYVEDAVRCAPIFGQSAANTGTDTAHCLPEVISDPTDTDSAQNHASDVKDEDPIQAQDTCSEASIVESEPAVENENLSASEGPSVCALPAEPGTQNEHWSLNKASALESEPVMENENYSANDGRPLCTLPAEPVMENEHLGLNKASALDPELVTENEHLSTNDEGPSVCTLPAGPDKEDEHLSLNKASALDSEPVMENEHLSTNDEGPSVCTLPAEPVMQNEHLSLNKASALESEPVMENEHSSISSEGPVCTLPAEPVLRNEQLSLNNASALESEPAMENENLSANEGPSVCTLPAEPVMQNGHLSLNKASALESEPVLENGHSSANLGIKNPILVHEICSEASALESEPVLENRGLPADEGPPDATREDPKGVSGSVREDSGGPVAEKSSESGKSDVGVEDAKVADVSDKSDMDVKLASDAGMSTDSASVLHTQGEPDNSNV